MDEESKIQQGVQEKALMLLEHHACIYHWLSLQQQLENKVNSITLHILPDHKQ
jgi:hypothetical protein